MTDLSERTLTLSLMLEVYNERIILQVTVSQVSFFFKVIWFLQSLVILLQTHLEARAVSNTTEEERREHGEGRQTFAKLGLGPTPGIIQMRGNSALLLVPALELSYVILSGAKVTRVLCLYIFVKVYHKINASFWTMISRIS